MSSAVMTAFEHVVKCLDDEASPSVLSKEQYAELLEELINDFEGRLEAVQDELNDEAIEGAP